ncbi:hypothetical protein SAMN04488498_15112 [Mesorhizobium albiziae]|uniref:Uncharacterized protein n=1 Tax=Neomesorhizobium albiziae TaxID=335020 RepID=A0A1I4FLU5_9HYPH|nr:hypothetical protein SAMN04488498_15112 [Mesorhizobium albiziae]
MKLFVAAMGASNYTYAEACPSESLPDWSRDARAHDAQATGEVCLQS